MRGLERARPHAVAHRLLRRLLPREVERRRKAGRLPVHHFEELAAPEVACAFAADQRHLVAGRDEAAARVKSAIVHQPDHADHRRRQDALAFGLVVKRDVAGDDRRAQRVAGVGDAEAGLFELPHDLRPLRIAEVQAVGDGQRLAADAGDVAGRLGHRVRRAQARLQIDPARIAADAEGHAACALPGEAHHRRVALPGPHRGADADHVIVLLVDPLLGGDGGRGEDQKQRGFQILRGRKLRQLLQFVLRGGTLSRPIVERRVVGERRDGEVCDRRAGAVDDDPAGAGDPPDQRVGEVPLVADLVDFLLAALLRHEEHPLLRFGEHHLVRGHPRLAARHRVDVEEEPTAGARGHLDRRRGQPRRAHVLDADQAVGLEKFEAGFEKQFLHEGIAHLHGGALLLALLVELGRGHGGAVDAVAAGARADVDDRIADAAGGAAEDLVGLEYTKCKRVDEAVAVVRGIERHLAADGGHADAVAVAGDARHHAFEQPRRFGV